MKSLLRSEPLNAIALGSSVHNILYCFSQWLRKSISSFHYDIGGQTPASFFLAPNSAFDINIVNRAGMTYRFKTGPFFGGQVKEAKGDSRFLSHDDSQIVRLLVYKIQREERTGFNTDSLSISLWVHNQGMQLALIEPT